MCVHGSLSGTISHRTTPSHVEAAKVAGRDAQVLLVWASVGWQVILVFTFK